LREIECASWNCQRGDESLKRKEYRVNGDN
jgi:hypothetical protein